MKKAAITLYPLFSMQEISCTSIFRKTWAAEDLIFHLPPELLEETRAFLAGNLEAAQ